MKKQELTELKATIIIQKWFRGYKSRQCSKKYMKNMYERKKVIEELVMTQQKYIHDLGVIVSDFQMHLVNQKIIPLSDSYTVFCNVDAIRRLNEDFFIILYNHFMGYQHYKIIFQDVKQQTLFFKIYFEYLNNFTVSMAKIASLKSDNPKFAEFVQRIKKCQKYNRLQMQDYLIKPIQRLPKYVLLLKLLVKKTPIDHPDYNNICKVLQSFQEVNISNNDKLNKLVNNYKLSELENQAGLPFHIAEPGVEFVFEQNVSYFNSYNKTVDAIMHLLNNRIILTKRVKGGGQKYIDSVNFKHGATILENQDQEMYQHSFTVQSLEGESITLMFPSEEQKFSNLQKIQEQILLTEKNTYQKYSALQSHNQVTESFIKKVCRLDLAPQVVVLGTQQRTDKMLKYTTYIVQVKIKNIRQKIFVRYSQLLEIQTQISIDFPKLQIKQSLYKTAWLFNHKPRTIQQRKMSIQRFMRQILAKPQIIECGQKILSKLGLPTDLYSLPTKFKESISMLKGKSSLSQRSTKSEKRDTTLQSRKTYRLSIFQDLSDEEDKNKGFRKHSYNDTLKESTHKKKLTIQQMIQANQMNLGHFIRYSQNVDSIARKQIKIQIYLPWIQHPKGIVKKTVTIMECQRVACLINKLSSQINLKYHKDFRFFLEREYSQRVLDDDQIIYKVQNQILTGKYKLMFKKMIYIDRQMEQNQIKNDRLRLKLIASQIVYEVKKAKYRLNYEKFLLLSVLIGIIQFQSKSQKYTCQNSYSQIPIRSTFNKQVRDIEPNYEYLAISTRQILANPYTSFYEKDKVWVKDFTQTYKSLYCKLTKISQGNSMIVRSSMLYSREEGFNWTNLVQLSYIAIIDQIKNNALFGSMCYIVQISQGFRQQLYNDIDCQNCDKLDDKTIENRNVWLMIKCRQIIIYSINLQIKLFGLKYDEIEKLVCYPSSIMISLSKSGVKLIKLKTTNSFCIRELLNYYNNYNDLSKKMSRDDDYAESVLEMVYENEKALTSQQQDKSLSMDFQEENV